MGNDLIGLNLSVASRVQEARETAARELRAPARVFATTVPVGGAVNVLGMVAGLGGTLAWLLGHGVPFSASIGGWAVGRGIDALGAWVGATALAETDASMRRLDEELSAIEREAGLPTAYFARKPMRDASRWASAWENGLRHVLKQPRKF